MGGSHWYLSAGGESTQVPVAHVPTTKKYAEAVVTAIEKGLVAAAHDVGMGGLAISLAEMCMGGDVGAKVDIGALVALPADVRLFSESNTRWVLEARDSAALEDHFARAGVPLQRIGAVGGGRLVISDGPKKRVDVPVADMRREF